MRFPQNISSAQIFFLSSGFLCSTTWYLFIPQIQHSGPQLCPTLWDPTDDSQPGSSVHGTFQARMLEWVAISSSRGGIEPASPVFPALAGRFVTTEPPGKAVFKQKSWSLTPYLRSIFLCYSCPRMTKTETKELFLILATFIPLSLNHHRVPYILSSEFSQTLLVFFIFTLNCLCYNLIIGLPSHHLCPILLVMSESQILRTPKGKNL